VQGVFFRAFAKEMADKLQLKGWVKNTIDGNVEIIVCGNEAKLIEFINYCWHGPKKAAVTDVVIDELPPQNFEDFLIVR